MERKVVDLYPGMVFSGSGKNINVVSINDGNIDVLLVKAGKTGKLKKWSNKKFLEKTKDMEIIFIPKEHGFKKTDTDKSEPKMRFRGIIIKVEDILLKTIPLIPNEYGIENFFIFAINEEKQEILIGESKLDNNPKWIAVNEILSRVPKSFLENISEASFEANNPEDILKQAQAAFKEINS